MRPPLAVEYAWPLSRPPATARVLSVGWNLTSATGASRTLVQTSRGLSLERYSPLPVAASSTVELLEIASRLTRVKSSVAVTASCFQATPSTVRKIPAPRTASRLKKPSPVPAYITSGCLGSIAMQETARFAMKSSTGSQWPPPSVVCQMPPPTLPNQIRSGWVGWTRIERVRPPMLPGPSHSHWFWVSPARLVAISARGSTVRPAGRPAARGALAGAARIACSSSSAVASALGGMRPSSLRACAARNACRARGRSG